MKAKIKKHFWYYTSFATLQVLGLTLILLTAHNKQLQLMVIIMTTILYLFWSLLHHYIHHSLPAKIVVEYVLIASLGITISLFIFNI